MNVPLSKALEVVKEMLELAKLGDPGDGAFWSITPKRVAALKTLLRVSGPPKGKK